MASALPSLKKELKLENLQYGDESMEIGDQLEDGEISDGEEIKLVNEDEPVLYEPNNSQGAAEAAKRFALVGDLSLAVPHDELKSLYSSLGIDGDNERHYRFNTVHMRGTGKMKTKDIFDYFSGLEPSHIEWLNDEVCNVEWDDEIMPARALLYLSMEIKNLEKRFKMESGLSDFESDGEENLVADSVDACKLKFSIPPGKWRKGVSCELSKQILVRYANKDDKKVIAIDDDFRERRRRHNHSKYGKKYKHSVITVEEAPRNPWGALAQTWGRGEGVEKNLWPAPSGTNVPDLRASLNDIMETRFVDNFLLRAAERRRKFPPLPVQSSESGSEDSESEIVRRRKLPKMYADKEEERQKIQRIATHQGDLRERLNLRKMAPPRSNLRKEVKYSSAPCEESGDELSSDWAVESYRDLRRTISNINREREDTEESESELELDDDEPGELLQIEIDNDRYHERRKHKH